MRRAALRVILVNHALAVPRRTTREQSLPGAVLTRSAASHIRIGTFEYFAARDDREALRILTGYALERLYPEAKGSSSDALALLERVVDAQANLVARWLGVGFVHGVMNTDNTSISGETIDYGPCAFLDTFDPRKHYSSIDHGGRYAFGNQPRILQWNLARLAESVLPLVADEEEEAVALATAQLDRFPTVFEEAYGRILRAKLGLHREEADDPALASDLLERLAANVVDYTLFFRRLCVSAHDVRGDAAVAALFADPGAFHDWAVTWRTRLAREDVAPDARRAAMERVNPAFIPRNQRVEEAISAATVRGDFSVFDTLVAVLARPYDEQPEHAAFAEAPGPEMADYRTFCGT